MTDLRGILFDKDGTLFNFVATWGRWSRALIADLSGDDARLRDDLARALGFDLASGTPPKCFPICRASRWPVWWRG
jgi:phosphoglycolate phosphatase